MNTATEYQYPLTGNGSRTRIRFRNSSGEDVDTYETIQMAVGWGLKVGRQCVALLPPGLLDAEPGEDWWTEAIYANTMRCRKALWGETYSSLPAVLREHFRQGLKVGIREGVRERLELL